MAHTCGLWIQSLAHNDRGTYSININKLYFTLKVGEDSSFTAEIFPLDFQFLKFTLRPTKHYKPITNPLQNITNFSTTKKKGKKHTERTGRAQAGPWLCSSRWQHQWQREHGTDFCSLSKLDSCTNTAGENLTTQQMHANRNKHMPSQLALFHIDRIKMFKYVHLKSLLCLKATVKVARKNPMYFLFILCILWWQSSNWEK